MKKLYLCFALALSGHLFAQTIPDFDFETWTNKSTNLPIGWGTFGSVTQATPSHSGSYAVKLQASLAGGDPGVVIYGTPGHSRGISFSGGIPFNARPDSAYASFKYSIATGDSAWFLVVLKSAGVIISSNLFKYGGSNTASFIRKAYKLVYTGVQTPDSLIIGFTSSDPSTSAGANPASWVILDDVGFTGTALTPPNPGFENWGIEGYLDPTGWTTANNQDLSTATTNFCVSRTTDHFAGSYAVMVQNIKQPGQLAGGDLYLGTNGKSGSNHPGMAINYRDTLLTGYYKFSPVNGDTCSIGITMYYQGAIVGGGWFSNNASVSSWSPFSITLNYFSTFSGTPDSALIEMHSYSTSSGNSIPMGLSVLKVDNLQFNAFATGIEPVSFNPEFRLSPNPFADYSRLTFTTISEAIWNIGIYDISGRLVQSICEHSLAPGEQNFMINKNGLQGGIYLLRMESCGFTKTVKIMVLN